MQDTLGHKLVDIDDLRSACESMKTYRLYLESDETNDGDLQRSAANIKVITALIIREKEVTFQEYLDYWKRIGLSEQENELVQMVHNEYNNYQGLDPEPHKWFEDTIRSTYIDDYDVTCPDELATYIIRKRNESWHRIQRAILIRKGPDSHTHAYSYVPLEGALSTVDKFNLAIQFNQKQYSVAANVLKELTGFGPIIHPDFNKNNADMVLAKIWESIDFEVSFFTINIKLSYVLCIKNKLHFAHSY